MRILITNDDGINAPGLQVLADIAEALAGPEGEVWTVAPAFEQSGVAHATSHARPTLIAELGPRRFAAEGSPGDCVLAGIYDVLGGERPDLVLSGVNRGNNSGENAMYSGTLGAAIEAALQGTLGIALSQVYGPDNRDLANPYEAAAEHGVDVVRRLLASAARSAPGHENYRTFFNVNFPAVPAGEVRGVKVTTQGHRQSSRHSVAPQLSPNGRRFLWIKGSDPHERSGPDTDLTANADGYVSVVPMRADLTAHDLIEGLKDDFAGEAP